MKPLSTNIYTFADLIGEGCLYVDKTRYLLDLVNTPKGQFFLSRPRRFGKSLMLTTLKAIFQGRRELFTDLHIAGSDYDWPVHPVVHLNLGSVAADSAVELGRKLRILVETSAREHGVELTPGDASDGFLELVGTLAEGGAGVVILIDEYDKPLLGHLGEQSAAEVVPLLKQFYSVIKTTESHQRFAMLTGVSKFSKVSIFSDLNSLIDVTGDAQYATMLGYTQSELEANFPDYIDRLTETIGSEREVVLARLRDWYNGYRFDEQAETVYNPVSVMSCFQQCKFRNYWFETGTPSFLIKLLQQKPISFGELTVAESAFSAYDPLDLSPLPLLVQTGYLTMRGVEHFGEESHYHLVYPNREIEQSFSQWLANGFCKIEMADLSGALRALTKALAEGRLDDMLGHLKVFFAGVPYDITLKHEKYYQTIFFTVFKLIGAVVEAETRTNRGRIDAVVKTQTDIYVFEFKLHGTAQDALDQIRDNGYMQPYRDDPRRLTAIGVAFDQDDRNIDSWLIAPACS